MESTVYSFDYYKDLYRSKRDAFQANVAAKEELKHWKARDDGYKYKELRGLVPAGLVNKENKPGYEPYTASDTFFSEYEAHNNNANILSSSDGSYIIGNLESYDKRQYPEWLDPKYKIKTPEGQGFGHTLVIPRKRVYNIVDPEATANDCAVIQELKQHFKNYWRLPSQRKALLNSIYSVFDNQNKKLDSKDQDEFKATSPTLLEDYREMAQQFLNLKADDFVYAFHPHPDHSVGHLHMHVFPKNESLRKFSSKEHEKKTIPFEAVLEVEAENKPKPRPKSSLPPKHHK